MYIKKIVSYSKLLAELESCMKKSLTKYADDVKLMNAVVTESHDFKLNYLHHTPETGTTTTGELHNDEDDENFFLPYTGNGYIGLSVQSSQGIFVNFQKSLSLNLKYNPLVQVYSDTLTKMGNLFVLFRLFFRVLEN